MNLKLVTAHVGSQNARYKEKLKYGEAIGQIKKRYRIISVIICHIEEVAARSLGYLRKIFQYSQNLYSCLTLFKRYFYFHCEYLIYAF
jgi:hypothetical protein